MARDLHILKIPFEASTSFLKGTRKGPKVILEELGSTSFSTTSILEEDVRSLESATYNASLKVLKARDFPLGLGGEHTVSVGPIRAAQEIFDVGVVQLDAHADLRYKYEDDPYSHACAMRRAVEIGVPLLGVGIRAMCEEEAEYVAARPDINLVHGREAVFGTDWYDLIEILPHSIYLTIDMDVFDPSEVPAVGNPETGGMDYESVRSFVEYLFKRKNVIAADIVELRPCDGDEYSVRVAADLVQLIANLI